MACPENSTLGICETLSETGVGVGELSNGLTANGGLTKLLFIFMIIAAAGLILGAIAVVVKRGISGKKM